LYLFLLTTISGKKVEVSGRIALINQGFPRRNMTLPQGFGIEFQSINLDSVDIIRAFMEKN